MPAVVAQVLVFDLGDARTIRAADGSNSVADIILERLPRTVLLLTTSLHHHRGHRADAGGLAVHAAGFTGRPPHLLRGGHHQRSAGVVGGHPAHPHLQLLAQGPALGRDVQHATAGGRHRLVPRPGLARAPAHPHARAGEHRTVDLRLPHADAGRSHAADSCHGRQGQGPAREPHPATPHPARGGAAHRHRPHPGAGRLARRRHPHRDRVLVGGYGPALLQDLQRRAGRDGHHRPHLHVHVALRGRAPAAGGSCTSSSTRGCATNETPQPGPRSPRQHGRQGWPDPRRHPHRGLDPGRARGALGLRPLALVQPLRLGRLPQGRAAGLDRDAGRERTSRAPGHRGRRALRVDRARRRPHRCLRPGLRARRRRGADVPLLPASPTSAISIDRRR